MAALPNSGITISMVANAIGAGNTDVGTLCWHPNVNKWSKWKPVRHNTVNGITLSMLQNINYGMQVVSAGTPILLLNAITNNGYDVRYLKPLGGSTSPYRLGDFRNYLNNAKIPCGTSIKSGEIVKVKKGSAYYDNMSCKMYYDGLEIADNDYNVTKNDLYSEQVYRGIMLTNGETSYWKTGAIEWNDPLIKGWLGNTQAFQFYVNKQQETLRSGNSVDSGTTFYAMPTDIENVNPYTLNVTNEYGADTIPYKVKVTASRSLNMIMYTVVFDASYEETAGKYLTNIFFGIYDTDGTLLDSKSEEDYMLQKGTSKTYIGKLRTTVQGSLWFRVYESSVLRAEKVVLMGSI